MLFFKEIVGIALIVQWETEISTDWSKKKDNLNTGTKTGFRADISLWV